MFEHPEALAVASFIVVALVFVTGIFIGLRLKLRKVEEVVAEVRSWRQLNLRKDLAYRSPRGNLLYCQLRSYDGGQKWYAVQVDEYFNSVTILGLAESVYPGILKHAGLLELTDFCFLNGGLTLEGEEQRSYRQQLRRAEVQSLARP